MKMLTRPGANPETERDHVLPRKIHVGMTSYRAEFLPYVEQLMEPFATIVLEEPQTPGFQEMLRAEMAIDDYLEHTDYEFPLYTRESCQMLRRFHARGKTILQVDPFMDELIRIHEFFVSGGRPDQLDPRSLTGAVYGAEKEWTGRLLDFYRASRQAGFEHLVSTVQAFSRADAKKGLLRDTMRASEILKLPVNGDSLYVEAGFIHAALIRELRRQSSHSIRVQPVYVMESLVRARTGRRQVLAPGDILTFLYTFRPEARDPQADLLAAQSLIYNKIVGKEEQTEEGATPHLDDEISAVSMASSMTYEQCRDVFQDISRSSTAEARQHVVEWIKRHRN
jgi:hypothetical protein